jgi:hypothetical protein
MNIATITAAAAPATMPTQTPAASVVAAITQAPRLTSLFRGRRGCAGTGQLATRERGLDGIDHPLPIGVRRPHVAGTSCRRFHLISRSCDHPVPFPLRMHQKRNAVASWGPSRSGHEA